ncbi:class E sortase [Streptomyces sp. SS7]|uniref:class E sortase n=1 Tax=Streptomyces sp. SS7 TaxID=3108485 RepID=UPI0030EE03D0
MVRSVRIPLVQHSSLRRRARYRRVLWTGAELLVTAGVLVLLLVAHQLWWTNREAREGAERKVEALEREWGGDRGQDASGGGGGGPSGGSATDSSGSGGTGRTTGRATIGTTSGTTSGSGGGTNPRASRAYAVLRIPRLGLRVPVAEGTDKRKVLNKGYVGHYAHTQQPGRAGNFAVAGHRNTHGEPFRHLDRLRKGDRVEVETRDATYTYTVDKILPRTSPRDSGVVRPVPRSLTEPAYGYTLPGHYLTLTTCTPEYTSRYRLVVWGKLVASRPRA